MNGSYSVPIGNSRSPLIECDRPSAESAMNRLFSAMPSSMCWPVGANSQLKVEAMRSLLNVSAIFSRANRLRRFTHGPRLVETVTSGDVVTMRLTKSELPRPSSLSSAPNPNCVDIVGWIEMESSLGTSTCGATWRRGLFGRERHAIEKRLQFARRRRESFELVPFVARANAHRLAQLVHLRGRHHAGVVVLVTGEREARALDGVADEAGRPVVLRGGIERLDQRRQVVPAEIAHQPRELVVRSLVDQLRHRTLIAEIVHQPLAPGRAALERQRRVELVRATVDPGAQRFAARLLECGFLQRAVLDDHHVPAERLEQRLVARPQALADHRVEALAIVVDHPPAIAQALLPAFEHRLEDVALVHLGVADQRDHAAFRPVGREVRAHVVLHQRGEQRLRDAEAHRAGREIDVVGYPWCATDSSARPCSRGRLRASRASACRAGTGSRGSSARHAASRRRGPAAAARGNRAPS